MEAVEIKTEPLDEYFNQIVQEEVIIKAENDVSFTISNDFTEVAEPEVQIEEDWLQPKDEPTEEVQEESPVEDENIPDQTTNTTPIPNQCNFCYMFFKSLTSLKLHERLHCPCKNDCRLCGQKFVTSYALNIHMTKVHSDKLEKLLPVEEKNKYPMGRPRNISAVIPDPRCDVCNLTFANSRDLNNHKKKHNTCQQCGEYFKLHEDLKRHDCENVEIKKEDEECEPESPTKQIFKGTNSMVVIPSGEIHSSTLGKADASAVAKIEECEPESPTKQIFKGTNSMVVIPSGEIHSSTLGKADASAVAKIAVSRKRKSQVLAEQNLNESSGNANHKIESSPKRSFSVVTKDTDFEAFAQLMMKGFTDISESLENKPKEEESISDKILRKIQSASNSGNEDSQSMEKESMSDKILRYSRSASNSGNEDSQSMEKESMSDKILRNSRSASNSENEDSQPYKLMTKSRSPELTKIAEPLETHDVIVDSEGNTYKILKENFVSQAPIIKEEPMDEESDNEELAPPKMPSPLPYIKDEPEEENQEKSNATDFTDSLLEELFDRKAKSIAKERQAKFGFNPSSGHNGLGFKVKKEIISPKDSDLKNSILKQELLLPNNNKKTTLTKNTSAKTKRMPRKIKEENIDQKLPTKQLPPKNNFLYETMKKEKMKRKLPTLKDANSDEIFSSEKQLILHQLKQAFEIAKRSHPLPQPLEAPQPVQAPLPVQAPQPLQPPNQPHPPQPHQPQQPPQPAQLTQLNGNETKKEKQLPEAYKTYDQMIALQFLELASKPGSNNNEKPLPADITSTADEVPSKANNITSVKEEDITSTTDSIIVKAEDIISTAEEIISTPDYDLSSTPNDITSLEERVFSTEDVTTTTSKADDTSQPPTTTVPSELAQNNNFDFEQMIQSNTLPNFQKINMVIKSLTEDYHKADKVKLEEEPLISKEIIQEPSEQSTDVEAPNKPGSLFFPILEDTKVYNMVARALNDKYRYAWICPLCPRQYYQIRVFKKHLLTVHYKDKGEYSGKTFELRPELIPENEEDENFCHLCHVQLADLATLHKHQLEIHKGQDVKKRKYVRMHRCYICSKTFPSRGALVAHMKSDCGNNPQYGCNVCDKKFHTKSTLTLHKTMHTGELPHSCFFCQKRFRTRGQLTVHTRTHTGEKPFPCKVCGQRFTHRETLIAHLSRHIDMKRYKCYGCDQFFSCISGLKTHRTTRPGTCGLIELDARAVGPRVRVIKGNVLFEPQPIFNARLTKIEKEVKYPASRPVFLDHNYFSKGTKPRSNQKIFTQAVKIEPVTVTQAAKIEPVTVTQAAKIEPVTVTQAVKIEHVTITETE